ncbi:uncharacterized protein LOC128931346 isoform X2 [Callithrix jacchus]|uniref:uncharacterized protein LOC128931346 isoform X2 n=1 Tax=Callithrix jacchus TaxID=9483 RepID=UPI00159DCA36|nr:uncharacterized protein LOC128931346 isoform X2 [Callithrix jacchus]
MSQPLNQLALQLSLWEKPAVMCQDTQAACGKLHMERNRGLQSTNQCQQPCSQVLLLLLRVRGHRDSENWCSEEQRRS